MINLIHFYEKNGVEYVSNGSSIPVTLKDMADRRVAEFLAQYCVETHLIAKVLEHHGGSDWGYANKVLDKETIIREAKSRGIGVAYDEDDMKRRNATCSG